MDLQFAALFHDLGKVDTTAWNASKLRITAYHHEKRSMDYLDAYLSPRLIGAYELNDDRIRYVVENHMRVKYLRDDRLMAMSGDLYFDDLMLFVPCDRAGMLDFTRHDAIRKHSIAEDLATSRLEEVEKFRWDLCEECGLAFDEEVTESCQVCGGTGKVPSFTPVVQIEEVELEGAP